MEKITCDMLNILQQKFVLYCDLVSVMAKERDYIINMDIESMWSACSEKKKIAVDIEKIKKEIADIVKRYSLLFDINMEGSDFFEIIRAIPTRDKVKSELADIVVEINLKKDELHMLSYENGKYVREYLEVINDVMSTIVGASSDRHYTYAGVSDSLVGRNCLINAEV